MERDPVVIIGGGIGGLTAAIDLAAEGHSVTILEKEKRIGGKMREIPVGGLMLDGGPTVFTMRHVFDELFAKAGTRLEDEITIEKAQTLARHAWSRTDRLDLFADPEQSAIAIRDFSSAGEADRYLQFLARIRAIYSTLDASFLRASRPNPLSMVSRAGLSGVPSLFALKPFSTLWRELQGCFKDPRLQQLYGRYATYCGSSPFEAAATLMIVAHVEQMGVYLVKGGMARLAEALERVAIRLGVIIRCEATVASIESTSNGVTGVYMASGERVGASAIIANCDANAVASGLFGQAASKAARPTRRSARSLSAMVTTMVAKTADFDLHHHTVFFSQDYRREFTDIFERQQLPGEPTVYICAQDRDAHGHTATERERLLFIVNAPANGDTHGYTPKEIAQCGERTMAQLQRCGLSLTIEEQVTTTPTEFHRLFPATGGALYGRASHGAMASFLRPDCRTSIKGLYLAGGSVHPGPGVPMAALSGRLAARSLISDRILTRRFVKGAISGGTAMPSATTVPMAFRSSGS
jgi:1-hydroxycarotenoid 3,4-desaturase